MKWRRKKKYAFFCCCWCWDLLFKLVGTPRNNTNNTLDAHTRETNAIQSLPTDFTITWIVCPPNQSPWVTVAQYIYKTDVNQQFRGAFDLSAFMMTMLMMYTQRPPLVLCSRHVYECTTCVVSARAPVCNLQFRFVCIWYALAHTNTLNRCTTINAKRRTRYPTSNRAQRWMVERTKKKSAQKLFMGIKENVKVPHTTVDIKLFFCAIRRRNSSNPQEQCFFFVRCSLHYPILFVLFSLRWIIFCSCCVIKNKQIWNSA